MKKRPSDFGYQYRQDLAGTVPDKTLRSVELFGAAKIEFLSVSRWKCYKPWYVPRRTIGNDFLLFVCDGTIGIETDAGKKKLNRGEFFMSAPDQWHAFGFWGNMKYSEHIIVHTRLHFPQHPFRKNIFQTPYLKLPETDEFLKRLGVLACMWQENSPAGAQCSESILKDLFIGLSVNGMEPDYDSMAVDDRLAEGIRYIRNEFRRDLSIQDIARQVELSDVHFRKLFREHLHQSPLDFLNQTRLQHACVLLQNSRKNIKQIADESGFNSVDYFCRIFKNRYQRTPTEYRHDERFR